MVEELHSSVEKDTSLLSSIVEAHYRAMESAVHIRARNGNFSSATSGQQDLIEDIVRKNSEWMIVSFEDLPRNEGRPAYYNVFLVQDPESLSTLLDSMSHETHHYYGLYTILIERFDVSNVHDMLVKLWSLTIMNVVIIFEDIDGTYSAYSYDPYNAPNCGIVEPFEVGRYMDGGWDSLGHWFPDRLADLHGCPLTVGVIEIKPYSMFRHENNRTVHYGLEVNIAEMIAMRMNFSINYVQPKGHIKWGILHAANSTGLVGMLQRNEAEFGFGSLGFSLSRYTYLKVATPSHLTQMIIGIPPKRPYTSLEKLFQPFTIDAWICIAVGYGLFGLLTYALVRLNHRLADIHFRRPGYTLWVMLMGGSAGPLRMDSMRMFLCGFILNTLVIRTLYQAGMFKRLQESAALASDLNTFSAINEAGLHYNMFRSTMQFYKDNPMVPSSHIRVVQNDHKEWDELMYELSQDRLGGVLCSPVDIIAYYVKRYGNRGIVYLGKNTGFSYNIGMHYPKRTPLQGPFDAWILRLHASGIVRYWTEAFRDNRYWTNAKDDPEPASLKWKQISGGFFLCGVLLLFATFVFLAEIIHHRMSVRRSVRVLDKNKPTKVE